MADLSVWAVALRRARKRAGLTQERLSGETGVSRWTLMRWEDGTSPPKDPRDVAVVAAAVGIAPEDAYRMLGWLPETADQKEVVLALPTQWSRQLDALSSEDRDLLFDVLSDEQGRRFLTGMLRTWQELRG